MTDPIFARLAPEELEQIARSLKWEPCVNSGSGSTLWNNLPTSARFEWLDQNREAVEDRIRDSGSWAFGRTRTYHDVIQGLAQKLDVKVASGACTREIEGALVKHIWQCAVESMSPAERTELDRRVEEEARKHGKSITAEAAIAGLLGAAQLSGFGVYMLGSTLLGGLGLGFGAFTALSSAIKLAIGPPGWIVLGLGLVVKLTAPNYKEILPATILVAVSRAALVEKDIDAGRAKLQTCRESAQGTSARIEDVVHRLLTASSENRLISAKQRLAGLTLREDGRAALARIHPEDLQAVHESEVSQAMDQAVDTAAAFSRRLEGITILLPLVIDVENPCGKHVSIGPAHPVHTFLLSRKSLQLQIRLNPMRLKHLQLLLKEKIWGWFSESARCESIAERTRLTLDRIEDAARQFEASWENYHTAVLADCRRAVRAGFSDMLVAIDIAELRLQEIAGIRPPASSVRIMQP